MEFIDEKPVVAHAVRFRNRITITETDARLVRDGNVVVWLIRAHCGPPSYGPVAGDDDDDRCRLNVQVVEGALPLDGVEREAALAYLDLGFDVPRHDDPSLFDANDFGPGASAELHRLRTLLSDFGELRHGEGPVEAVQRLLTVPVAPPAPASPTPPLPLPDHDGIEVVGSVPRSAETQRYLDEAFGR
jgi:hypothetical protein